MENLRRLFIIGFVSASTILAGCGKGFKNAPSSVSGTSLTVKSIRYYKGGWLSIPSVANWSHDMTIDFSNPASIQASALVPDSNCTKSGRVLLTDAQQLAELVPALTLTISTGAIRADGGIETILLTRSDNSTLKIHLDGAEAPQGEYVATNGTSLGQLLRAIDSGLTRTCP